MTTIFTGTHAIQSIAATAMTTTTTIPILMPYLSTITITTATSPIPTVTTPILVATTTTLLSLTGSMLDETYGCKSKNKCCRSCNRKSKIIRWPALMLRMTKSGNSYSLHHGYLCKILQAMHDDMFECQTVRSLSFSVPYAFCVGVCVSVSVCMCVWLKSIILAKHLALQSTWRRLCSLLFWSVDWGGRAGCATRQVRNPKLVNPSPRITHLRPAASDMVPGPCLTGPFFCNFHVFDVLPRLVWPLVAVET